VPDGNSDRRFNPSVADLARQLPAYRTPPLEIPAHRMTDSLIRGTPIDELFDKLASFHDNWIGWTHWAFPWGEPDTPLEDFSGPEEWQADQQRRVSLEIQQGGEQGCVIEEDVASGHGIGKLLADDTLVPTPEGLRRHGDLTLGDLVFDADGHVTRVVQTHHFTNVPMYRVTFDDGSTCDVSSGHLWNVRGRQERRKKLDTWRTLETIDILRRGVKRANGVAQARQWEIPQQGPAKFVKQPTALHPYVMGVWLGDGSRARPAYTKPHAEVKARVEACGYGVTTCADGMQQYLRGALHIFTGGVFECYSSERYIPDEYKFNTVGNRRALFDGLMDADGEVNSSGSIGYSTTSKQLAEDVIWLARSLGCKAMMQPTVKCAWYVKNGERVPCKGCWRVTINAPFNPFTIAHRRDAYKPSESRYLTRWIDSIEPIAPAAHGMCISVEAEDGLYQANDFIVTHNSGQVGMFLLWAISTFPDTRGVVTANTDLQLRTKTWAELAKWHGMFIARHLFTLTATSLYIANDADRAKQWRIDQVPWSAEKTEAFAGMHNQGKRIVVVFDEASNIHDNIWTVTRGALTDAKTQILWMRYGNPTRTSGEFFKQCNRTPKAGEAHHVSRVDSRRVSFTNKRQIQAWIDEYGEDSDFVRVRVKGMFPRSGYDNFIAPGLLVEARKRRIEFERVRIYQKVLSIDPARFGDDFTVISLRQGARLWWQVAMAGFDGPDVAGRVLEIVRRAGKVKDNSLPIGDSPISCIAYDAVGNGADLDAMLRRANLPMPLIPVTWGNPAKDDKQYFNQRSEAWGRMRDWLETAQVPDDDDLSDQCTSLQYGYDGKLRIQLETKKDAKKRGVKSPDRADSLALSFIPDLIDRKVTVARVRPQQQRRIIWSKG
jgi:hypothetical protein